jgi:hypothetical protein
MSRHLNKYNIINIWIALYVLPYLTGQLIFFQDSELLSLVDEAWDEAWEIIIEEEGWKEEKKGDHGDVVKSKKNKKGKNIKLRLGRPG